MNISDDENDSIVEVLNNVGTPNSLEELQHEQHGATTKTVDSVFHDGNHCKTIHPDRKKRRLVPSLGKCTKDVAPVP